MCALCGDLDPKLLGIGVDYDLKLLGLVILKLQNDPEAGTQRRGQSTGQGRGTYQRKFVEGELDGTRRGALSGHDVDAVILHGRIHEFLDHGGQTMDLVDEAHRARLQIGQKRRRIALFLKRRPGGLRDPHPKLVGYDVGKSGFT